MRIHPENEGNCLEKNAKWWGLHHSMSPFWLIFLKMVNLNNCIYFWRSRVSKIPYIHRGQFFWGYRRAINAVKLIKLRCFYNRQNDIIAHNVVQDYGVDFKINKMEVIWSHHQLPFCDSQEYLKNLFKMVLDLSYQNMDSYFFFFYMHQCMLVSTWESSKSMLGILWKKKIYSTCWMI